MASQRCPRPNPQNLEYMTLQDKEDLADITKLRTFRWGDCPGLSESTQEAIKGLVR